jgi:hypothetical protein
MCVLCEPLVDCGDDDEDDEILEACAKDELQAEGLYGPDLDFSLEMMRSAGCFRPPAG